MDTNRLKIELTNAITAELATSMKAAEDMTKYYAVNFMESETQAHKDSYRAAKIKYESFKMAIEMAQRTSRSFKFEEADT